MNGWFILQMKKMGNIFKSACLSIALFIFLQVLFPVFVSAQYVSPFVYENGTFRNKTRPEISQEEANNQKSKSNSPTTFPKPGKETNSSGEVWISGYCRYRPPSSSPQEFYQMSEIEYLRPVYPREAVKYADDFSGKGNISWDECKSRFFKKDTAYQNMSGKIAADRNDGISMPLFQKLLKSACFFDASETLGKHQFSRSIKVWIKRVSGPDNMDLSFSTAYSFNKWNDRTNLKIDDNGKFEVSDFCQNCKSNRHDLKSGKVKSWAKGGWNEVGISKNEFNTVKIHINGEVVFEYQIPDIPIAIRYSRFNIDMPSDAEKKKLEYRVGAVTIEEFPLGSNR
jgi:hypothetical protein